jgi:hypothetical protein
VRTGPAGNGRPARARTSSETETICKTPETAHAGVAAARPP